MKSNSNKTTVDGGIGFVGLLTIAFIVLKLTGVISWSWVWVLAPLWISAVIYVVLVVAVVGWIFMFTKWK